MNGYNPDIYYLFLGQILIFSFLVVNSTKQKIICLQKDILFFIQIISIGIILFYPYFPQMLILTIFVAANVGSQFHEGSNKKFTIGEAFIDSFLLSLFQYIGLGGKKVYFNRISLILKSV